MMVLNACVTMHYLKKLLSRATTISTKLTLSSLLQTLATQGLMI